MVPEPAETPEGSRPANAGRPPALGRFAGQWFFHVPRWRIVLAFLGVLFVGVEVVDWRRFGMLGRVFTYTAFLPLQIGSLVSLHLAGRRRDLPPPLRHALRLLTLAFGCAAAGTVTLAAIAIATRTEPNYTPADFFYVAFYPLAVAAFLAWPRAVRQPGLAWRLLGYVVPIAATVSLIWALTLIEGRAADPFGRVMAMLYPIGALAALLAANTALTTALPQPSLVAFIFLVGGLAVDLLGDLFYQLAVGFGYVGVNWSIPLSVATNLAVMWGAWRVQTDPVLPADRAANYSLRFSPLPLAGVAGVAVLLAWIVVHGGGPVIRPVLFSLMALNLFLIVRDGFAIYELAGLRAIEKTRETEARYEAMARHGSDVVMVIDERQRIRFGSPAVRSALGLAPEAILGTQILDHVHPSDQPAGGAFLDNLVLQPEGTHAIQWRLRHADGTWRACETLATNLLREPAVAGLVLNSRDVTERERMAEQLRQAGKMEAVGRMAGGVAHDFNNLLTAVLANTELALGEMKPGDPVRADLEQIQEAASRGAALTGRLLAFSRRQPAELSIHRIGPLVAGSAELIERLVGERIRLTTRIGDDTAGARVDADDLEHALLNLATNARDAMPDGGDLTLAVDRATVRAPIRTPFLPVPAGDYVVIEVTDSGVGMDEAIKAKIFEPFFTTKQRGRGTGFGLAGVYGTVKQAKGGIVVESAPGRGASFKLYFPLTLAVAPESSPAHPARPAHGTGTVLLVEDDTAVRSATSRLLRARGYEVIAAADAAEARTLFATNRARIDMVLTDVIMPGGSGPSLAAEFLKTDPDLPVLFMSGYTGEELESHGLDLPGVNFLRKPFTVEQLAAAVGRLLRRSANRTE